MIAFGPVPSRRLGRSLGINNLPAKWCSYSCAYCQIGRTVRRRTERQEFFQPDEILRQVEAHLEKLQRAGDPVDYLTFVANGEPTLDINIGGQIRALKPLGVKIAVITNASLLWRGSVRADLAEADWVSIKVDTIEEKVWRKLNKPHPTLRMSSVLRGLFEFAEAFSGKLVTETMLVRGVNDEASLLQKLSDVLSQVNPRCCYLAIPTRPPAEAWVKPPSKKIVSQCHALLAAQLPAVECLTPDDEGKFTVTDSAVRDLLSIIAVHPMEQKAVKKFLAKAGADWTAVEQLLQNGRVIKAEFAGKQFYRKAPAEVLPST